MGSPFVWDGSVLRAPIKKIATSDWHALPSGPPWAAPSDMKEWMILLNQPSCMVLRKLYGEVDRDFACHIRVINHTAAARLAPCTVTICHNNFDLAKCAYKTFSGAYKEHLAAGSYFELSPIPFEPERSAVVDTTEQDKLAIPRQIHEFFKSPVPFDIRFSFPRSGQDLWADSKILRTASPYFKDMLNSGFKESQTESYACNGPATTPKREVEVEVSDSDDDDSPVTPPAAEHKVHTITVTNHAFNTYSAVLGRIITKSIAFAPLSVEHASSILLVSGTAASQLEPTEKRPKRDATSSARSAPPSVSPKSVYRLAHLLELDELRVQALGAFKSSLTVDNVAHQLFSSAATSYEELRTVAVGFVVGHWNEVEKTTGMQEMRAKVEAGELDHGGIVSMTLACAALTRLTKASVATARGTGGKRV